MSKDHASFAHDRHWDGTDRDKVAAMLKRHTPEAVSRYIGMPLDMVEAIGRSRTITRVPGSREGNLGNLADVPADLFGDDIRRRQDAARGSRKLADALAAARGHF